MERQFRTLAIPVLLHNTHDSLCSMCYSVYGLGWLYCTYINMVAISLFFNYFIHPVNIGLYQSPINIVTCFSNYNVLISNIIIAISFNMYLIAQYKQRKS